MERALSHTVTRSQRLALVSRADLLAEEAALVVERRLTWSGRLAELGDYGRSGGSAADRRLIVEAMAAMEADGEAPMADGLRIEGVQRIRLEPDDVLVLWLPEGADVADFGERAHEHLSPAFPHNAVLVIEHGATVEVRKASA
jgi:hypothetical protein